MQALNVQADWTRGESIRLRTYRCVPPDHAPHVAMVVLPGFGRTVADLAPWLQATQGRFATTLIELPGQGGSEAPAGVTLETLAAEIRAAFAAVTSGPAILVGESLGGLIALTVAADPPANLTTVLAVDPPLSPTTQPHLLEGIRQLLGTEPQNTFIRAVADSVFGLAGPHTRDLSHRALLDDLRRPTLLLSGDIDLRDPRARLTFARIMGEAEIARLQADPPANVVTRVIAGAGHKVLTEQPAAALDALASFIGGLQTHHAT